MPKQNVAVELFYDSAWHDIAATDEVFASSPITITRGQGDASAALRPTSISLSLKNQTDKFRTSNPQSPLYGKAGRNTPVRVKVDGTVRGTVEASSWSPDQTPDFRISPPRGKAWVDLLGGGLLQRIGQWTQPLRSPLYRAVDKSGVVPAEYWPMEEASGSGLANSAVGGIPMAPVSEVRYRLPDGTVLTPGGAPDFGSGNGVPGSAPLPNLQGGGTLRAPIRTRTFNGYAIDWVMQFQAGSGLLEDGSPASCDVLRWRENGTYVMFTVGVTPGNVSVFHANEADAAILAATGSASASFDVYDGMAHHFRYQVRQNGGNYRAEFYIDSALWAVAENFATPGSMAGTVKSPISIEWNPGELKPTGLEPRSDCMPASAGHLIVWASGQIGGQPPIFYATNGYAGERTSYRIGRLFGEEGIPYTVTAGSDQSTRMGPQRVDSLPNLLKEIVTTEDGLLYERIDDNKLRFVCRVDRYNKTPSLELVPSDLAVLPREVTDDQATHNVVTASQANGGDHTVAITDGPLSNQNPPDGAGEYRQTVDVNVNDPDADLPQIANWWARKGTVDLPRFPQVTIDLGAKPSLISAVEAADIGSVITITGVREFVLRLIVIGWVEVIGTHTRTITFTCVPDQQFDVGFYGVGSDVRRYDSASSYLVSQPTTSSTTVKIGVGDPLDIWSTVDTPYDILIAGERMTVTAMSADTGGTQIVSGSFESGTTGWGGSGGSFVQSSAFAHGGSFSGLLTVSGSPSSALARVTTAASPGCVPGAEYTLSIWLRSVALLGDVRVRIEWLDANFVTVDSDETGSSLASGSWVQRSVTATAPDGAVYMRYGAVISSSPANGTLLYIDDVSITSGTARFQDATVDRSVNGIVKIPPTQSPVHVATPGRWAL